MKVSIILLILLAMLSCVRDEIPESPNTPVSNVGDDTNDPVEEKTQKESFRALLSEKNKTNSVKLVWVGDSITEQGKIGHGNDIGFTTYIEELYPKLTYVNEGVGGNTTIDILNRIASIKAHDADVYFVAVGINDSRYNDARGATTLNQYRNNIIQIIDELASNGSTVILNSIFPSFWQDASSALNIDLLYTRYKTWNAELKRIASSKGLIYIDSFSAITNFINFTNVEELLPDGVHPKILGTAAKRLYAESILYDDTHIGFYEPQGDHFFKLSILDNDVGGYCSIKNVNISSNATQKDLFGFSQNGGGANISDAFNIYDRNYAGFTNKANQFPFTFLFSTDIYPDYVTTTGKVSGLNINRGIRSYKLYYSQKAASLENLNDDSWVLVASQNDNTGVAVNLLPAVRDNVFYQLKMDTNGGVTDIKLSKLLSKIPVRVWTQNERTSSSRHYDKIFDTGIVDATDYLIGVNFGFNIIWEAEQELKSLDVATPDGSLLGWTLKISSDPEAFGDPSHASWVDKYIGTGSELVNLN